MKQKQTVDMVIQKYAREFRFFVKKTAVGIGVETRTYDIPALRNELCVVQVYANSSAAWTNSQMVNVYHRYDLVLAPYMRVIAVNRRRATTIGGKHLQELIAMAKPESWIELTVRRCAIERIAKQKVKLAIRAMVRLKASSVTKPTTN